MQTKKCIHCRATIEKKVNCCQKEWENKKFCSRNCHHKHIKGITVYNSGQFKKGQKGWNKGLKGAMPEPWNKGLKGIHLSPETEFKKGQMSNEEHLNWKGNKVGIQALHTWIRRHKKKPNKCPKCGKNKPLELSNIDHKYNRNLDDYRYLCRSCHRLYDIKHNGYKTRGVDTSKNN